ncbi:hypothetical protein Chor_014462, partial [Crotalus horridus]
MVPLDAKGTIREIVLPKGLDLDRPKRTRTSFTAEQLYRLELEFQRCQYVVGRERTELARQLNLSETQVKVWFQNRRTKQKKEQSRDSEKPRSGAPGPSEALATCSLLRLLEQGGLLSVPAPPALLPTSPHPPARLAPSPGRSRAGSPPATGAFSLRLSALAEPGPSPALPAAPLAFGSPLAGSPLPKLPAGYGPAPSAFEPYARLARKGRPTRGQQPPQPPLKGGRGRQDS